jgi:hypothetical protein
MERYRLWFERLLNWLTEEAEAWAESGKRRPGEAPMLRRQAPPALREWDPALAPTLPHDLARAWEELTGQPVLPARRAA